MAPQGWTKGRATAAGGSRDFKLWVPSTLLSDGPAPLMMVLHGCTHNAETMAEISGMNEVANANRFLLVYPEQTRRANLMKCWNWFLAKHQARDAGEPSILAAIVEQVRLLCNVDTERIYAMGVSAGGAMAVIAGATYPDIFAGVAVAAGGEFKAATTLSSGFSVMKRGGPDPVQQGQAAFEAMKAGLVRKKRRRMPVMVIQGTADNRVSPVNADQIIAQWGKTNACLAAEYGESGIGLSERVIAGQVAGGHSYRRHVYTDHTGALLMEKWMVEGLGHAWSGSPRAHKHGDPKGPAVSAEIWRFFCEAGSRPADFSVVSESVQQRSSEMR